MSNEEVDCKYFKDTFDTNDLDLSELQQKTEMMVISSAKIENHQNTKIVSVRLAYRYATAKPRPIVVFRE